MSNSINNDISVCLFQYIIVEKYNKLVRLWMNGQFYVLIKVCDIAFIPLLYTQLQLMRVSPPVVPATAGEFEPQPFRT